MDTPLTNDSRGCAKSTSRSEPEKRQEEIQQGPPTESVNGAASVTPTIQTVPQRGSGGKFVSRKPKPANKIPMGQTTYVRDQQTSITCSRDAREIVCASEGISTRSSTQASQKDEGPNAQIAIVRLNQKLYDVTSQNKKLKSEVINLESNVTKAVDKKVNKLKEQLN